MTSQALKIETDNVSTFNKKENKKHDAEDLDLREGLETLKQDVAKLTQIIAKNSMEELGNLKETVVEKGGEILEQTTQFSKEKLKPAEEGIKKRPFVAVGAAFGLGFLASMFMKRSS